MLTSKDGVGAFDLYVLNREVAAQIDDMDAVERMAEPGIASVEHRHAIQHYRHVTDIVAHPIQAMERFVL